MAKLVEQIAIVTLKIEAPSPRVKFTVPAHEEAEGPSKGLLASMFERVLGTRVKIFGWKMGTPCGAVNRGA